MTGDASPLSRLAAKRQEQTPQAFARLVVVCLFIALWLVLLAARIPMPVPFLLVLLAEVLFFAVYLRVVAVLPSLRSVEIAQYVMLAAEIIFHTTIVYFLGGISWLGAFAYVFGLIFANTFLDMRRGLAYTLGASAAFISLIALEATGTVPHYVYLDQGPLRYADPRFVATTAIGAAGVFFSIFLWVNWVGYQLRRERDAALRAQDDLLKARGQLQLANEGLELRVQLRTTELETANAALRESEQRLRTVVSNAPIVLFALDTEGVFTLAEGKALDDIGTSAERLIDRSVSEIYSESPEVLEAVRRALAGEQAAVVAESGEVALEALMGPVFGPGGEVLGIIGVATNITERRRAERELEELRRRNELILNSAGEGIYGIDLEGRGTFINPSGARLVGWDAANLIGQPLHPVLHHSHADGSPYPVEDCPIYAAFRDGTVQHVTDEVFWRKDGTSFAVEYISTPIRDERGEVVGAVVTFKDITERRRAEDALRESEETLKTTIESTADGILVIHPERRVAYANRRFIEIWHLPDGLAISGNDSNDLVAYVLDQLEDPAEFVAMVEKIRRTPGEWRDTVKCKDGRVIELYARAMLKDGQIVGRVVSFRDVTDRRRAEEALHEAANRDPLTGVLNRRAGLAAIHEQLEVAKQEDGRFAALVLDLDRFKSINDNFSHEAGDTALLLFTRVLEDLVVDDGVICRLGGDEFEIGLPDLNLDQALVFGERILTALQRAQEHVERPGGPRFTVSIGVACFPEDGDNVAALGRRADEGMYAAKAAGGNRHRAWRHLASRNAA